MFWRPEVDATHRVWIRMLCQGKHRSVAGFAGGCRSHRWVVLGLPMRLYCCGISRCWSMMPLTIRSGIHLCLASGCVSTPMPGAHRALRSAPAFKVFWWLWREWPRVSIMCMSLRRARVLSSASFHSSVIEGRRWCGLYFASGRPSALIYHPRPPQSMTFMPGWCHHFSDSLRGVILRQKILI